MDLLTQGILGASTAQSCARQSETRIATVTGFLAGLVPDLDTLIRSAGDSLLVLEYHRHFTHSFIFIPVAALLASSIIWLAMRKRHSFRPLYLYALLGASLAGLLDACTSYGTSLLWPFSNQKIAWNLIAIIDPVYTLLLLVPLFIGLKSLTPQFARAGLVLSVFYLSIASIQLHRAEQLALKLTAERRHHVERLIVKPTMGNILLWRSLYLSDGRFYSDAVRPGLAGDDIIYQGTSVPQFKPGADGPFPENSQASRDLLRFAALSDDWVAVHPARPDLAGDVRYSMLPVSTEPLWGVNLDDQDPDRHLQLVTNRTFTARMRNRFIDMVLGRPVENQN